jgi:MFS family permease
MIPRRITVVSLAVATSLLGDATLYTVLPAYAEQLGIRLALVGVLLSVNRFVRLLSNSWAGHVHDRFHSFWPFVIALVVGACTTAIYGLLWGFWIFLTARLIWGICWSFLRSEGYTSVIIEASPHNRGKLMGIYRSISALGFMAGGFLGGVLTDTIGYRNCLLSFACFSLLGAFAAFLEQSRDRRSRRSILDTGYSILDQHPASSIKHQVSSIQHPDKLRSPEQWLLYLMGFTNILVSGGMIGSTLGRLLKERFGMTISFWRTSVGVASATGGLFLIRRAMSLLLCPILGHLADRMGRRFVLTLGLTISVLALLGMATQHHFALIGLAVVASSVAGISISVSLDASIADVASERRRGQLVSRYVTFMDLGSACGPLISYLLLGARVSIEWVYLGGLALLIAACILYGLRTVSAFSLYE